MEELLPDQWILQALGAALCGTVFCAAGKPKRASMSGALLRPRWDDRAGLGTPLSAFRVRSGTVFISNMPSSPLF